MYCFVGRTSPLVRFDLVAPAKLHLKGEPQKVLAAETRDISEKGVFLRLEAPLPEGSEVDLEVLLSIDKLLQFFDTTQTIKLTASGQVVRTEQMGVAVKFQRNYRIEPTTASVDNQG